MQLKNLEKRLGNERRQKLKLEKKITDLNSPCIGLPSILPNTSSYSSGLHPAITKVACLDKDTNTSLTNEASQFKSYFSQRFFLTQPADPDKQRNSFKCPVCLKHFQFEECLKHHIEKLHDPIVDLSKLENENKADFTNRVIRSGDFEEELFGSLHLEDFDHRSGIIKDRALTKKS